MAVDIRGFLRLRRELRCQPINSYWPRIYLSVPSKGKIRVPLLPWFSLLWWSSIDYEFILWISIADPSPRCFTRLARTNSKVLSNRRWQVDNSLFDEACCLGRFSPHGLVAELLIENRHTQKVPLVILLLSGLNSCKWWNLQDLVCLLSSRHALSRGSWLRRLLKMLFCEVGLLLLLLHHV